MIILFLILPILFEAVSEGLYLRGMKTLSKQIQVLMFASWFACMYYHVDLGHSIAFYMLIRFALFNYIHNIAAGLKLNFLGTTSIIDRMLTLICFGQWWMILLAQGICLTLSYFILIGKL